jgi:nucleotide-binding universal stress UspA family protein
MTAYQRILLATDLSEQANRALAEAVSLARKHHAELHVLHVDVIAQPSIEGFEHEALASHVRSLGQTALSAVGGDVGVGYRKTVTAVVRDTSAAAGILRYAAEQRIDLIVMGTHGRGPVAELVLGSVAQQVVRESKISMLVVGGRRVAAPPAGGKPVVLAFVTPSPDSAPALRQAASLAHQRGAHLVALHVLDVAEVTDPSVPPGRAEVDARDEFELFVERAQLPLPAEALVGVGAPEDVIFDLAAKRGAGLVVLAPTQPGLTRRVIRGAPCPVLAHRDAAPGS